MPDSCIKRSFGKAHILGCLVVATVMLSELLTGAQCSRGQDLPPASDSKDAFATKGLDKFDKLRVNERNYGALKNIHYVTGSDCSDSIHPVVVKNSYYTAIKALIGHMGKNLFAKLTKDEQRRLANCLDRIEDRRELVLPARCLTIARKRYLASRSAETLEYSRSYGASAFDGDKAAQPKRHGHNWIGQFLQPMRIAKLTTKKGDHSIRKAPTSSPYKVESEGRAAPVSSRLEKYRSRGKRSLLQGSSPDGDGSVRWRSTGNLPNAMLETRNKFPAPNSMNSLKSLFEPGEKSLASRVSNLIHQLVGKRGGALSSHKNDKANNGSLTSGGASWERTYENLMNVKRELDQHSKLPGARVFERRMYDVTYADQFISRQQHYFRYDIVLDKKHGSMTPSERRSPIGLIQTALGIFDAAVGNVRKTSSGKNDEKSGGSNRKFLSPRFMPLMPDKYGEDTADASHVLSPSILAFYRDKNSVAPLPELLERLGLNEADGRKIVSMLMDVTGSTKDVDLALDLLRQLNFISPDVGGPIVDATERILGSFKKLGASLRGNQRSELDASGMTFIRRNQVETFLKDQAPINADEIDLRDVERFEKMTPKQREIVLWETIKQIARNETEEMRQRRAKRSVPFTFYAPVVLAPYAFAPTSGLVVLGPLVLSPFIFSPLLLNPTIASPFILSPGVADPLILSPYIFGPFILGPFVMTPFILNPYVISPNILNPYVLSPLILSPIALSPDIVSPMTLGGAILSPAVLSPSIFTDTFLMVNALSPTFLSK